jgi:ABC-type uncharacterized transport system permease subunit
MSGVSVSDVVDIFWYIIERSGHVIYTGLGIFLVGLVALLLGFKFIPEAKKVFAIIFSPVIGCGCLVLLYPVMAALFTVLMTGGVIALCKDSPAC